MKKKQPVQHITADVPAELIEQVDARVEALGVSRSFAVRKGLTLFLRSNHQELIENITGLDGNKPAETSADAAV